MSPEPPLSEASGGGNIVGLNIIPGEGEAKNGLLYRPRYIIFSAKSSGSGGGFVVKHIDGAHRTIKALVKKFLVTTPSSLGEAVQETINANRNNRRVGTRPDKPLALGTAIRIPRKYVGGPGVEIEVLADEAGPTPTGGYAKWARIPRPQRKELTILEGYPPMTFSVPILFDAVRENVPAAPREDCELKIQYLEGLAGRGIRRLKGVGAGLGKPPLIKVFSVAESDTHGIPLIPKPFQTANVDWFIDNIEWNDKPLRSAGGARIRQAAVVSLVEYVTDGIKLT